MASSSRAYFEQQRESLIGEIAMVSSNTLPSPQNNNNELSFEHVLANINKLNRNLEAVIAVGNEFSSVEALWSTFENVMGKEQEQEQEEEGEGEEEEGAGKNSKQEEGAVAEGQQQTPRGKVEEVEGDDEQMTVDGDGDVEMS
ncbi:hypothetical protein VMCG_09877 [Cytospora schulzeri]|uniref:DASH complex subunit DAD1 n=1 Tax=Cytospora schulzeri TaxID=448051 RepID=A0A423VDN0_9PEZI|nr:hypothetical protein VMCG_09877 [Valsa malicola]